MAETDKVASWRIILAFLLDLITAFLVFGYLIALAFGGTTAGGFSLQGWTALLLFAVVIAYFVLLGRFLGGTVWQRILRARR